MGMIYNDNSVRQELQAKSNEIVTRVRAPVEEISNESCKCTEEVCEIIKKPTFSIEEVTETIAKPVFRPQEIIELVQKPKYRVEEVQETIRKPVFELVEDKTLVTPLIISRNSHDRWLSYIAIAIGLINLTIHILQR